MNIYIIIGILLVVVFLFFLIKYKRNSNSSYTGNYNSSSGGIISRAMSRAKYIGDCCLHRGGNA